MRQFDFDPIERVLADRGKYIAAALTICRAYFVAGRPDKAPKLASFEGWSDTVRSALLWLGKEDPVKSMEFARQEDPELIELAEMLEAWSEVMGMGGDSRAKLADVPWAGQVAVAGDQAVVMWFDGVARLRRNGTEFSAAPAGPLSSGPRAPSCPARSGGGSPRAARSWHGRRLPR